MQSNIATYKEIKAKPFLKWAGGKNALMPKLLEFVPPDFNRYFEPFLGGGAMFFALSPSKACISDVNKELINTYNQIKKNVEEVISLLSKMKYGRSRYYKIRGENSSDPVFRAARFIYLNRTCWNGLYRENRSGQFNVPLGRYLNPLICDEDNLFAVHEALKNVQIKNADFVEILRDARANDLVYLDPPYVTTHANNGFLQYNSLIFSIDDQIRLRDIFVSLHKQGCKVILSNANHKFIRNLYKGFNMHLVNRMSLLAADKNKRRVVSELIITNFKNRRRQNGQNN